MTILKEFSWKYAGVEDLNWKNVLFYFSTELFWMPTTRTYVDWNAIKFIEITLSINDFSSKWIETMTFAQIFFRQVITINQTINQDQWSLQIFRSTMIRYICSSSQFEYKLITGHRLLLFSNRKTKTANSSIRWNYSLIHTLPTHIKQFQYTCWRKKQTLQHISHQQYQQQATTTTCF